MDNKDTILGIEFGDPDNPIAIAHIYNEIEEQHGIAIRPVLNTEGLNTGDDVSIDRVGDIEFLLIFRTETSVNTMIKCLLDIKEEMEQENHL